jgi:hypothetical protein
MGNSRNSVWTVEERERKAHDVERRGERRTVGSWRQRRKKHWMGTLQH